MAQHSGVLHFADNPVVPMDDAPTERSGDHHMCSASSMVASDGVADQPRPQPLKVTQPQEMILRPAFLERDPPVPRFDA